MAVGAIVARILTQYSNKGSKAAQKDIQKLGAQFDDFSRNAVRAFGIASAAVSAFAVKLGKDAVAGAMADQKAQIALATALRNTVGANQAAIDSTVKYLDKLELASGVNNDELIPSLQKLVTVTGDIATAQQLQAIALDVSAGTQKSLITVTDSFVKAIGGNIGALKRLGVPLSDNIVKSKDFTKAITELNKIYAGQADARAKTFEFRMLRLRFAFDQVLDSLGYALIPVLEDFVKLVQSKILPQLAKWVEINKRALAEGLKSAAEAALELLKAAVAFGAWVVENFNTIKNFGILLASIWATGKVYAFITAIGKVSLAFKGMQAAAVGAGAASAAATAGSAGAGAAFLAGARALGLVGVVAGGAALAAYGLSKISPGEKARAKARAETQARIRQGEEYTNFLSGRAMQAGGTTGVDKEFKSYLDFLNKLTAAQNKLNGSKKKELTTEQKIINAMLKKYGLTLMTSEIEAKATAASIAANLTRQGEIAKSPTVSLAAQGDGSATGNSIMTSGAPNISVTINTPHGTADDYAVTIQNNLATLARRRGGISPSGRPIGMYAE